MIGAGTIINPILKIVTTVAILAAVYFFIVKPTLETTEDISNRAFDSTDQIQDDIRESIENSVPAGPGSKPIDVKIPKSAEKAQKLGDCVSGAVGDVAAIQKCVDRLSP